MHTEQQELCVIVWLMPVSQTHTKTPESINPQPTTAKLSTITLFPLWDCAGSAASTFLFLLFVSASAQQTVVISLLSCSNPSCCFFVVVFFKGHHLMSVCDIRAIWSNLTMLLLLVDISVTSQLSKLPVGTLSLWKAMLISYQWVSYHKHTPPPFDYFCNNEGWREVPQADTRTKRIEIKISLLWLWETSRSNKV